MSGALTCARLMTRPKAERNMRWIIPPHPANALESKQIAELHEHRVIRAGEAPEPERLFIQHVAAVAREHDRTRRRLIAEQRVDVEEVIRRRDRARYATRPGDQDRRVLPRVITQRIGLVLDVLSHQPNEERSGKLILEL